jgi:hypothetical protein
MNTKNNSQADPEQDYFDRLVAAGEIKQPVYGVITDGLCATPEAQDEFDKIQKGKPPLTAD